MPAPRNPRWFTRSYLRTSETWSSQYASRQQFSDGSPSKYVAQSSWPFGSSASRCSWNELTTGFEASVGNTVYGTPAYLAPPFGSTGALAGGLGPLTQPATP